MPSKCLVIQVPPNRPYKTLRNCQMLLMFWLYVPSRSNNIYHLLGVNQCNPKATEGRTTNRDLLSNEPKMYWFTTDLSHIQHQLTKTIDVQPVDEGCLHNKSISFLSVDLKWLSDMMRNKNFEASCQSGVNALAVVLGTYINRVISGNVANLIHWKNVFGAKKYQKEPAKRLTQLCL